MKKILLAVMIAGSGMLAGVLGQWGFAGGGQSEEAELSPISRRIVTREGAGMPDSIRGGKVAKHDLAALLQWRQRQNFGSAELSREMERMSKSELENLLADFASRQKEAGQDAPAMSHVMEMAAKELYGREDEDALKWAAAQGEGRRALLFYMISAAAHEDPGMSLPWLDGFLGEYGSEMLSTIANEAVKGSTARGAEDLLKLKDLYGERLRGVSLTNGPLPDDFDFQLFARGMKGDYRLYATMQHWAAKDKDAAWMGLKEGFDEQGRNLQDLGALFSGVAMMEGDRKAAEWLIPKLDEVPAEQRVQAVRGLRGQGMLAAESLQEIVPLLRDEGERVTLVASSVSPLLNIGLAELQCLSSEKSRTDALVEVAGAYASALGRVPPVQKEKITGFFRTVTEELKLSDGAREQVMETLQSGE